MMMERRIYPRGYLNLPAELVLNDGTRIQVLVLDISEIVLKVQCHGGQRDLLTPRGEWTQNGHPIKLDIRIPLPKEMGENTELIAHCELVFSRRVALDTYHIGMRYVGLDDEGCFVLGRIIDSQLKKKN